MTSGYQSDVGAIRSLLVKHAEDAFGSDRVIAEQWLQLGYSAPPDYDLAVSEHERFTELLESLNVAVHFLPPDETAGLDSIYARDASVLCDKGAILCRMGKEARRSEPASQRAALEELNIPIHGTIDGSGCLEGGDVVWLDPRTVAVGRGYRTNAEGIRQLGELLRDCVDRLIVVPLPHFRGPKDVFHLMSILSPIDDDLALVYSPLMAVEFRETLLDRGVELVEVPDDEFDTMGCNVLAVGPRRCVMLAGNPETRRRLEAAGAEVHEYEGREISSKGAGGPTCLTRPLLRELRDEPDGGKP